MKNNGKGCDLCNNPTTKFEVWAKGTLIEGILGGTLYDIHFEPSFCPCCGRRIGSEAEKENRLLDRLEDLKKNCGLYRLSMGVDDEWEKDCEALDWAIDFIREARDSNETATKGE